jgi:hypothetical protein
MPADWLGADVFPMRRGITDFTLLISLVDFPDCNLLIYGSWLHGVRIS